MFTWNRKWTLRPIMVGNTPIELSSSAKFLGVTLDSKLNYNEHITKITNKATASLMQCKKAVGPTWGLTPKTCKWLYTTVIRPILTYCVSIWIRATHTKHNAKKIERVQALALRIMSGAMPSTPFNTLNHITNTINIIPFLQGEAAKGASRLQGYGDWTSERRPSCKGNIKAHSTINNDFLDTLPIPKAALRDLTRPIMKLESKFTIENPINDLEEYRKTLDNIIRDTPNKTITCYTDGSRTDSGSGAGYIITTDNNNLTIKESHFKLPDYSTVFQAELIAIKEACNYLTSQNNKDKDIIIWTDSLSSIQALANITSRSITVNDCYNALQNIATHNNVTIKWVAAHTGIWGNEKADSLAKAGTTSTSLIKCPIPQSHIKTLIDNKVKNLNNNLWKTNGHSHTDMALGNKHKNIIKQLNTTLIYSRKKYRTAVHLISGHCTLNKHLHTIRKVNSSTCSNCQLEDETVNHFLGQCPSTSTIRSNFFHDYTMDITEIFDKFPLTTIINFTIKTQRLKEPEHLDQSGVT
ncbi:MAG: reverse transcriptase-like protein [Cytophagales bacterium]|nr:reverse transcriptase-like protein [Cytophagales bacterium]